MLNTRPVSSKSAVAVLPNILSSKTDDTSAVAALRAAVVLILLVACMEGTAPSLSTWRGKGPKSRGDLETNKIETYIFKG